MFRQKRLFILLLIAAIHSPLRGQDKPVEFKSIKGPTTVKLSGVADVAVPADCVFFDAAAERAFLKASGDDVSGREAGMIEATNHSWSTFFEYSDEGHVKDDEKAQLDSMADKLLASYKDGAAQQNKERESAGAPRVEIVGWEQKPHYDEVTHNLTWAIRGTVGGQPLLNYNTRLLGREGFMEVVLACEPADLSSTLPAFTNLLAGYSFSSGQTYAEYRQGDKLAKYGLAALIIGGAGVAAAKLGLLAWVAVLFKKAWKLIVVAFAAVATWIKKMYSRVTGRKSDT